MWSRACALALVIVAGCAPAGDVQIDVLAKGGIQQAQRFAEQWSEAQIREFCGEVRSTARGLREWMKRRRDAAKVLMDQERGGKGRWIDSWNHFEMRCDEPLDVEESLKLWAKAPTSMSQTVMTLSTFEQGLGVFSDELAREADRAQDGTRLDLDGSKLGELAGKYMELKSRFGTYALGLAAWKDRTAGP